MLDDEMDIDKALIYYKGSIDEKVLEKAKTSLQKQVNISSKLFKKMFSIFVELAQNISRHSSECNYFGTAKEEHGVGVIRIDQETDYYCLQASNWMRRKEADDLINRCEKLNRMSYDELRKLKQETFAKPREVNQVGGKVGLIQIVMRSKSPLTAEINDLGNQEVVYLNLSTKISIDNY